MEKLEGWKTYICVVLMLVTSIFHHIGILESTSYTTIMGILVSLSVASLKSSQSRIEKIARGIPKEEKTEKSNEP